MPPLNSLPVSRHVELKVQMASREKLQFSWGPEASVSATLKLNRTTDPNTSALLFCSCRSCE